MLLTCTVDSEGAVGAVMVAATGRLGLNGVGRNGVTKSFDLKRFVICKTSGEVDLVVSTGLLTSVLLMLLVSLSAVRLKRWTHVCSRSSYYFLSAAVIRIAPRQGNI